MTSAAPERGERPLSVLIAGGGTAGHIEPALAVADALRAAAPQISVVALGTARGLETTLIPQRGYPLELIRPVPLPRKPSRDLLTLPVRMRGAIREVRAVLQRYEVDVVVGFGGYVALPAYLAARRRVPVVIHEANARAGLANKVGARWADAVFAAVAGSGLAQAEVVGIPVRQSVAHLDRAGLRAQAREFFGLDAEAPTLLVSGGSQGAVRINAAISGAAADLAAAGIGVLHAFGRKNEAAIHDAQTPGAPPYVGVPYLERMDLAFAAADLVIGRSGAMTVAETGAVGLPAIYVPLPHGNGEQSLNARGQVDAGSALVVPDTEFDAAWVRSTVIPLLSGAADPAGARRFSAMVAAAQRLGGTDVGALLADRILRIGADGRATGPRGKGARR